MSETQGGEASLKKLKVEVGVEEEICGAEASVSATASNDSASNEETASSDVEEDEDKEQMIERLVKFYRDRNVPEISLKSLIESLRAPHVESDSEDDVDPVVWEEYCQQIRDTEGFGLKINPGNSEYVTLRPLQFKDSDYYFQIVTRLAKAAMDYYNKNNMGKEFKVVEVDWAVSRLDLGILYLLTFKAEDSVEGVKIFEAQVLDGIMDEITVDLCRMKKMKNQTDG